MARAVGAPVAELEAALVGQLAGPIAARPVEAQAVAGPEGLQVEQRAVAQVVRLAGQPVATQEVQLAEGQAEGQVAALAELLVEALAAQPAAVLQRTPAHSPSGIGRTMTHTLRRCSERARLRWATER